MDRFYAYHDKTEKELAELFLTEFASNYRQYLKRYFGLDYKPEHMPNPGLDGILKHFKPHADKCLLSYRDYWEIALFRYAIDLGDNYKAVLDNVSQVKLFVEDVAYSKMALTNEPYFMASGYKAEPEQVLFWDWMVAFYERHFDEEVAFSKLDMWLKDGYLPREYIKSAAPGNDFLEEFLVVSGRIEPEPGPEPKKEKMSYEKAYAEAKRVVAEVEAEQGWTMEIFDWSIVHEEGGAVFTDSREINKILENTLPRRDYDYAEMYLDVAGLSGREYGRKAVAEERNILLRKFQIKKSDARAIQEWLDSPEGTAAQATEPGAYARKKSLGSVEPEPAEAREATFEEQLAELDEVTLDVFGTLEPEKKTESKPVKPEGPKPFDIKGLMGKSGGVSGGVNGGVNGGVKKKFNLVLGCVENNPGLRVNAISKKIKMRARTVERHIKTLKREGRIEFIGAPKNGGYYIKKGE